MLVAIGFDAQPQPSGLFGMLDADRVIVDGGDAQRIGHENARRAGNEVAGVLVRCIDCGQIASIHCGAVVHHRVVSQQLQVLRVVDAQ
jgi:hypothetical protein